MDWTNHFGQVSTYFQKSIRARWGLTFLITEHCFGHEIVIFSPILLIFGGYAPNQPQLVIKLKIPTDRTTLDKFLPISKKVSELFLSPNIVFPSPNIVLVTKSSILVQLCSFLVGSLQFSHNWGWDNKKMDWANHFELVFTYFQKSIRNFSITEHCFGHQIVNFSPIVLIFGVQAPI